MLDHRQQLGKSGETTAVQYLKKNGYRILEQNYRTDLGEIDIIAKDKDTLVFIEVKARTSYRFGDPKYAVTQKKQRKISMVALSYLVVRLFEMPLSLLMAFKILYKFTTDVHGVFTERKKLNIINVFYL